MSQSFTILGSRELLEQVTEDINHLFEMAKTEKFNPVRLSIGPLVVEIGCIHKIINDLNIGNWNQFIKRYYEEFSITFKKELLEIYLRCENNNGIFDLDTYEVPVVFDPDEPYMSLQVSSEGKKTPDGKKVVDIYVLTFKPNEILCDFNYTSNN